MVVCEFPECTTFGSVIRFALELEKGAAGVYEELANDPKAASAAEMFRTLVASHKKRGELLEDTRQQKLNEMILEPIQDIRREDYLIDTNVPVGADAKAAAAFAASIEETSARFYSDSAKVAKSLLHEAARVMERMAKENLANKDKLASL